METIPINSTFAEYEKMKKGNMCVVNNKPHTVIDIKYLFCKGNVHHRLRHMIFTMENDEDKTIVKEYFRVGYRDKTLFLYKN
jgi:hypothetical protein